jgi:hypothetical protein
MNVIFDDPMPMPATWRISICVIVATVITALQIVPVDAQETSEDPPSGFVRLANALAEGTGPVHIEVAGVRVNPDGYQLGEVTGGIPLPVGNQTVRIWRQGTKEGITRLKVEKNETTILIPFAERMPATDDEPAHWAIRVLRMKQQDPKEDKTATFISVSRKPEIQIEMRDPDGRWTPQLVKRLVSTQSVIRYPRGYVPLRTTEGELTSIPVASNGNYVVLLYDDAEGKVRSVNFRDRKHSFSAD